jgi:hypothetical protein
MCLEHPAGWGPGGRRFKSCLPDERNYLEMSRFWGDVFVDKPTPRRSSPASRRTPGGLMDSDLPDPADARVVFVGPFEGHDVVVEGRQVPFLQAAPADGGIVDLTLDRRIGLRLTVAEAERFVPFLADAIAVGLGYTSHPDAERDGPNPRHPFPRITALQNV